jgi:hypothetical protein
MDLKEQDSLNIELISFTDDVTNLDKSNDFKELHP